MALELKALLDSTGVTGGIDAMRSKVNEFGREVNSELGGVTKFLNPMTVAAIGIGVALDVVKEGIGQAFEKAEQFTKMSEQFGVGTTKLQELGNAAVHNGSDIDTLSGSLNKLTKNVQDAVNGNQKQIEAFQRLGVTTDDLKSKSLDQIYLQIADGVKDASNQSQAYNDVLTTMGKSAGSLIPTLKQGSQAILEQGDAAGTMSETTIVILDKMKKAWAETVNSFITKLGNWTADVFTGLEVMSAFWDNFQGFLMNRFDALGKAFSDVIHGQFRDAWSDLVTDGAKAFDTLVAKNKESARQIIQQQNDAAAEAAKSAQDIHRNEGNDDSDSKTVKQEEKEAEEIKRINEETEKIKEQTKMEGLTNTGSKMAELKKRINSAQSTADGNDGPTTELMKAKARQQVATLQEEYDKLAKERDEKNLKLFEKGNELDAKKVTEDKKRESEKEKRELESVDKVLRKKLEDARKGQENLELGDAYTKGGANLSKGAALALSSKENFAKQQVDLTKQMNDNLAKIAKLIAADNTGPVSGISLSDGSFN